MSDAGLDGATTGAVDDQHPWLGLDSFSEQTRAYFYGRDEEVAELARRIQRKTLTILFGQSGLGKTSILRAGLVPQLRPQGYCPVYVRLSYAVDAPPPAEQIKQAIVRATTVPGPWTQAGVSVAGETLWEFLHHRDDRLRDEAGAAPTPLLIFDQFEEIFTLAQTDDAGKRRVARFVEELADLVENRPPSALEARMEADDALAAAFDFAREDVRVLISLREDYLAHLEGLRGAMPSITQNRMRLARMNGQQALAAVTRPGGRLVSEEVAQAIVRFVAGGAELANAELEPSLLSLICRELNNQRIAQRRAEISTDLLAGSHVGILAEFYDRVLADMPEGVHRVIEEDLLTEAGYRENLAEERVLKAFAAAGAPPGALALLVNRRLLRIEERLDVRRVELTHDVLCGVVLAARARRQERQAREAAERQLAQQAQERARSRHALMRARRVAAGCIVLAVLAVAGGVYGHLQARNAERTRGEAQALVGYLLDDFYKKLEPSGHADLIGDLVDKAAGYYRGLPAGLRDAGTQRNRAMVLLRQGEVLYEKGLFKASVVPLNQAIVLLERDVHEPGGVARSLADLTEARAVRVASIYNDGQSEQAMRLAVEAEAGIRQAAAAPGASRDILREYGQAARVLGFNQARAGDEQASMASLRASQRALSFAARGDQDLGATLQYIATLTELREGLCGQAAGQDEARAIERDELALIDLVLRRAPSNIPMLQAKVRLLDSAAERLLDRRHPGAALATIEQAQAANEQLRLLDPGRPHATDDLVRDHMTHAAASLSLGQVDQSQAEREQALAMFDDKSTAFTTAANLWLVARDASELYAEMGDALGVHETVRRLHALADAWVRNRPPGSPLRPVMALFSDLVATNDERVLDEAAVTPQRSAALLSRLAQLPAGSNALPEYAFTAYAVFLLDAQVAYAHGEDARAAESAARSHAADLQQNNGAPETAPVIMQALALARLGRAAEAQALVQPLIGEQRVQMAAGDDQLLRVEFASTLLASALSDPAKRQASLREARQLLDALPASLQAFSTVKTWRARITQAQAGHG